jgi:KTSC domain-containing protein
MYLTMIPVNSSAIRAVGYDGNNLTVEFHNGRIYEHPSVPYSVYAGLMQAPSKGAYYNQNIRGRYK